MSLFGTNKNFEARIQSDIRFMKLKVIVGLFFFSKVEFEKEENEVNYLMENELKEWCTTKGYKISIRDVYLPNYITGHSVYQLHDTRHCKIISFSK